MTPDISLPRISGNVCGIIAAITPERIFHSHGIDGCESDPDTDVARTGFGRVDF